MIDNNSIEELKSRLDVVDVVGGYIELKKAGANYKANCPFHGEKTPSFVVSPSKQIFHCFGCGVGGDSIKFVMEYEKLSYPEAIEKLANQYNFSLTYTQNDRKKDEKNILEKLNNFFVENLDRKQDALEYLTKRGIYESTIEKFQIGYAPRSSEVMNFFSRNFFAKNELIDLGAVAVGEDGHIYSRFIERITFPIYSSAGKVVGFGGRTITNHPAKYINSPQSKVFNKSRLLYGYHKAKQDIFSRKKVVVTEGYLDVIMLHQAGFNNAVATLGTALTAEHMPLLRKGEPEVILSYDGDKAGIEAALKASKMLSAGKFRGGVVLFGEGKDPADMVAEGKLEELKKLFGDPRPFVEFVLETIISRYDLSDPFKKEKALVEVKEYLNTLSDIVKGEYAGYAASMMNIDERIMKLQQQNVAPGVHRARLEDVAELSLIKTLLSNERLIDEVLESIDASMFKIHQQEFHELLRGAYDSPILVGLSIREDIKEYSSEELKAQLAIFLVNFYNMKLKQVPRMNISFEKKNFLMRKYRDSIMRLKKGELVAYEIID
jgi:DNA primase